VIAIVVDGGDASVHNLPVAVEDVADVLDLFSAHIACVDELPGVLTQLDSQRVVLKVGVLVAAAGSAAVSDVAIGRVVSDFALEERADTLVGEVTDVVRAGSQVLRKGQPGRVFLMKFLRSWSGSRFNCSLRATFAPFELIRFNA